MRFVVEYRPHPNSLRLRLMCDLGERDWVFSSKEQMPKDFPYHRVFSEWFDHGIAAIAFSQHVGFWVVDMKKDTEISWDEILERVIPKGEFPWEEWPPRITEPEKVWPYEELQVPQYW